MMNVRVVFGDRAFDRASRELTCRGAVVHGGPKRRLRF